MRSVAPHHLNRWCNQQMLYTLLDKSPWDGDTEKILWVPTNDRPEHLYWILLYEFDIASNRHISYRLLTGHIVAIAQPINNYLTQRQ